MAEPTSTTAAAITLAAQAAVVPVLSLFGMSLGLRADVLLAGFAGSVAAMALLNTVPASGDTPRELWRTSGKRIMVAVGSSATAGYISPLVALLANVPEALMLGIAFVVGAGAQTILPRIIERLGVGRSADGGNP